MTLASFGDFGDLGLSLLAWRANSWWGRGEGLRRGIGDLNYLLRPGPRGILTARLSAVLGGNPKDDGPRRMARRVFQNSWAEREVYWLRLLASEPVAVSRIWISSSWKELRICGRCWKECPLGKPEPGEACAVGGRLPRHSIACLSHGGSSTHLGQLVIRKLHRAADPGLPVEVVDVDENSTAYIELLMERLRQHGLVCINAFGTLGRRFVEVDFLGRKQRFAKGFANLAISTGAAVIPALCYRDPSGRRRVRLERPWPMAEGERLGKVQEQVLQYYVATLEAHVRQYPDQWFGWHSSADMGERPRRLDCCERTT